MCYIYFFVVLVFLKGGVVIRNFLFNYKKRIFDGFRLDFFDYNICEGLLGIFCGIKFIWKRYCFIGGRKKIGVYKMNMLKRYS